MYRHIFKSPLHLRRISTQTGPNGLQSANYLTDSLKSLGIKMYRFKTGTPARIDKNSIDFTKMEEQKGDERVVPFLLRQIRKTFRSIKCHAGLHIQTKRRTKSFGKSGQIAAVSGAIEGTGPRYCPSIEDKVVKLPTIKQTSRSLLSRKESIQMKCMSAECRVHYRKTFSMQCIEVFRVWNMQRS